MIVSPSRVLLLAQPAAVRDAPDAPARTRGLRAWALQPLYQQSSGTHFLQRAGKPSVAWFAESRKSKGLRSRSRV